MSRWTDRYQRLPTVAQHAAITAYGLYTRAYRFGAVHRRWLRFLRESEFWTWTAWSRWQLLQLHETLANARLYTPLYGSLPTIDPVSLAQYALWFPTIGKADLQACDEYTVTSKAYPASDVLWTGGTTGTPLPVYTTRDARQRHYAFFSRLLEWHTGETHPRTAIFGGRTVVPADERRTFWRRGWNTLHLSSFHLSPRTAQAYRAALRRFRPTVVDGYPSALDVLIGDVAWLKHPGRANLVLTSSETLSRDLRRRLERAFGTRVSDYYSSTEMGAFIAQCERGTYHAHPAYGIVEILRENGQPCEGGEQGEIVVTPFGNPTMPLIRYRTGDLSRWSEGDRCGCGRAFPALDGIEGRVDDVLVLPDGRRIGRLDSLFKQVAGIAETQLVQDGPDHVTIRYVPISRDRWNGAPHAAAGVATLVAALRARVGDGLKITPVMVSSIPRTGRGKRQTVVRHTCRTVV